METYSVIAEHLARQGWAVTQKLLLPTDVAELRREVHTLWTGNKFKAAGVGKDTNFQIRTDIRSDHILWLDDAHLTTPQMIYRAAMEALRQALNAQLYIGVQEFEAHYAVYPPGAFYQKHLDRFSTADERMISCSLYLNPHWEPKDGGALRLYENGTDVSAEIYPQAGTFVIFRSDTMYHEVLPATRERFSLTGWFKRRSLERLL